MVDIDKYQTSCTAISQALKQGRGGVYVGGFEVLGMDIFGHKIIMDSRHFQSLKVLYIPPPAEISVLALILNLVKLGMVCVDVGAGCGYYTYLLASLSGPHGKVYSFEMIPECFALLQKNMDLNNFETVICENRLVSNEKKKVKQVYFGESYRFFYLNAEDQKQKEIEAETISLDKYFDQRESGIDVVKINLEDQLLDILKGMNDIITFNPDIKILCLFNQEKMIKNGNHLDEFFDYINKKKLKLILLPTLKTIDKEELLSHNITKNILLSKNDVI